jgi:phage tail-like protein
MISSAARFRNPPPGPPNDPTWLLLEGRNGWPVAPASSGVATSALDCALVLQNAPGGAASLVDPFGRFGGLVQPPNVALGQDGAVWLLDVKRGRLRCFDSCACAFVDVPHTGGSGSGARRFVSPIAIAIRGRDLLVLDAGGPARPGRVLAFSRHSFALRAVWAPPRAETPSPWRPTAFAVTPDGRTLVADAANGLVHVFDRGGAWRASWAGFGTVVAMAVDRFGRIYTLASGADQVRISGPDGTQIASASDVATVRDCFPKLTDFASDADGRINLAGRCADAGWYDSGGQPSTAAAVVQPVFVATGTWFSSPLDSGIGRCVWHRVVLDLKLPSGAGLTLSTLTSEVAQPDALIQALPPTAWTTVNLLAKGPYEALILSQPGRYLWLRATLTGNGQTTPRLETLRIEYPRISLRRYLPRAFGPDPVSADFADRLLGVFDQGFRSVESEIDRQADLFDPRSAPATSPIPGVPDMLTWLASWIGVTFDRAWPVARRRHLLMMAARLYPCRGTLPGMRRALLLFLGLDTLFVKPRAASCAPPCAPKPREWEPPPLILEHWKIRRWLYLGAGRLGDAAVLWGQSIMGRSQLDNNAQAGVTRLDTSGAATLDPFNADAYAFTVFVPGGLARTAQQKASVRRLIDQERPAWTQAKLRFVLPRMRIGIQASIGFDAVVGCWPEGVLLNDARLGKATVLSAAPNVDRGPRVGQTRIGAAMRIA